MLPDEDLLKVTQDALKAEKIYSPPDEPDPLHPLRVHRKGRPRLAQHELVGDAGGGMAGLIEIATDAVDRFVTDCDVPMPAHEPASTDAWKPVGGSSPVRWSQAFEIDFQCLSRSAINSARFRSSRPSRMLMSSGSARK